MAVPKKKKSRMRRNRRRAQNDKITLRAQAVCPTCGAPMIPHRVCPSCGKYKDREIIKMEAEE
jgi:large subunit ribosomal protein L32